VVRNEDSHAQSLISIASLSDVRASKTFQLMYLAWAAGCLLMAVAAQSSKEASCATLPFVFVGVALLTAAQVTRRAAILFVVNPDDVVQTSFGTLRQAATLLAAVRFVQEGKQGGGEPYSQFLWVRAYLAMLV
jgi:hypothetical protein